MYKSHLVNVKELKVTQHPEQRRKKREGTKVVSIFSNNRLFYITEKIYNWEDSKLRSFEFSILLFSWITKAIESISSQSTCHLVGLNELGKNQKFALNLLNQLTTKSWEWHPQQNLGNDTQNSKEKRRERGEGCPDFTFSYTTKAFEFISSQCSEQKGKLTPNPDFRCSRCQGRARPIDGRPHEKWTLAEGKELEVEDTFCYLGDTGGAHLSLT